MKKLPKEYIILELIPNHSNPNIGFIVQIQALKIQNDQIIERFDGRVKNDLVNNQDLLKMISYDKEMFTYYDTPNALWEALLHFIRQDKLLIIDNAYTLAYLKNLANSHESILSYFNLSYNHDVFDQIIKKYQLEPSNHLVDLLYEALIFAKTSK